MSSENDQGIDKFEFLAAVLLGIAAICTALASLEAALWSGKSVEGYGRANTEATKAATEHGRAMVEMSKDASVDITASRLILEGDDATNPADKKRSYEIATYLYTKQMSEAGYKALGLPLEARKPVTDDPNTTQVEKQEALQDKILTQALETDLVDSENYRNEMLAASMKLAEQSEKTFKEGQEANTSGDKFQFAGVIFAVSLFFVGIALVFRSKTRWTMLYAGGAVLILGVIYMLTLRWTF
jgi:Flp pilus assembly protein TadB